MSSSNPLFQNPRNFKGHSQAFINWLQFQTIHNYCTKYSTLHFIHNNNNNNNNGDNEENEYLEWKHETEEILNLFSVFQSRTQLSISLHTALTLIQIHYQH